LLVGTSDSASCSDIGRSGVYVGVGSSATASSAASASSTRAIGSLSTSGKRLSSRLLRRCSRSV
jgi:hypothetical protein